MTAHRCKHSAEHRRSVCVCRLAPSLSLVVRRHIASLRVRGYSMKKLPSSGTFLALETSFWTLGAGH